MTLTLADYGQLRSGMALAFITPDYTLGDCIEASWAPLKTLVEFDDEWAQHLHWVEGELHHPTAMDDSGKGFDCWLEWRPAVASAYFVAQNAKTLLPSEAGSSYVDRMVTQEQLAALDFLIHLAQDQRAGFAALAQG